MMLWDTGDMKGLGELLYYYWCLLLFMMFLLVHPSMCTFDYYDRISVVDIRD